MVKSEKIIISINNKNISSIWTYSEHENNNGKIAILVHGGPGGCKDGPSNLFVELAKSLANSGIDSVRFDFRGEGDSEGDYINTTMVSQREDFQKVYSEVIKRGYKQVGVVEETTHWLEQYI